MKTSSVLLVFTSAIPTVFAATCGIQGGDGSTTNYYNQLYGLRGVLCGSGTYASCQNTTTYEGCFVQDSSDNFAQAMTYGQSPQGQTCWDAFDDIYNTCIKNNWLSGLYALNGNIYLMTLEGWQN